jgi:hypothetical protein
MERSLSLVRSSKRHMLMATIYISDIGATFFYLKLFFLQATETHHSAAHKSVFDAQWDAWVPAGTAPVKHPFSSDVFRFQLYEIAGACLCSGAARIFSAVGGTAGDIFTSDLFMTNDISHVLGFYITLILSLVDANARF